MSFFRNQWVKKTRKLYRCMWCDQRIEAGSAAERSSGADGGDFWSAVLHPECAAARDSMPYGGLADGYGYGEFSRGRTDDDALPPQFSPDYRGRTP